MRFQKKAGGISAAVVFLLLCGTLLCACGAKKQSLPAAAVSSAAPETAAAESPAPETPSPSPSPTPTQKLVVIDPGHQRKADLAQEAVGPGAAETKYSVSGGAQGAATGQTEYALNLAVSEKLKAELEARGYRVLMTRESNDVDIPNSERAAIANDAHADAFVRIHANGSSSSADTGAMTICQTAENPYNAADYAASRRLSDCVLSALTAATGAKDRGVWETDTMSGINWCTVPVTIVEMGFLSNPDEDRKLAQPDYQQSVAVGIADGLDAFFA